MKYCGNGCQFYHTDYMSLYNAQVSQEHQAQCPADSHVVLPFCLADVALNSSHKLSLSSCATVLQHIVDVKC